MTADDTGKVEYFFNTRTKMVEKGRQSSWEHVMGPYATHEEANKALETADARNQQWEDEDDDWQGDDD
jgi:hypothetical protein